MIRLILINIVLGLLVLVALAMIIYGNRETAEFQIQSMILMVLFFIFLGLRAKLLKAEDQRHPGDYDQY